ncbi:MAG: tetratricopeptide repeat protein [Candidatus Acidiferrales bacterium]
METPAASTNPRWALLLVCFAAATIVSYQALRIWLADYRVHTDRVEQMERGAELEPGNATAWDRLGRVRQADFENPDPARAVADFQKAVQRDPRSADYWMDLAGAYEATGNIPLAREAFGRARAAYPASAQVAWIYGNFLLRQGQFDDGFAQINQAARADPSLLPLAISRTWHSNQDVNLLLDRVLPADENAYFQAIDFMASRREPAPALAIWQRILSLGKPIALPRSFPLLELLIQSGQAVDASRVWREALRAAGQPHDEPANHSLIWNGDFARDFADGGLDWRWNSPFGAAIDFDAPPASGGRSVRLDFGGAANVDLDQPLEFVPVEPARSYHFHAEIRTEGITTESGLLFVITDPNHHGALNIRTENLTGTHPWSPIDADFTTGPETHFVVVQLRRFPSRLFENKLSGAAWIGAVSLIPSSTEEQQPSQ